MKRTSTTLLAVLTLVLVAHPAAAGGGGGGGSCRGFSTGDELVMRDSCFEGTGHVAEAGTTLTVVNAGDFAHTFTAVDGSFDSGIIEPGGRWRLSLPDPGMIPVYCTLHASPDGDGMAGLLAVAGAGTVATAATESGVATPSATWGWWLLGLLVVAVAGLLLARRRAATHTPVPSDS